MKAKIQLLITTVIPTLAAQSEYNHCIVPMCDMTPFMPSMYSIA